MISSVLLVLPFLFAARRLAEARPFIHSPASRFYMELFDTVTFESIGMKSVTTALSFIAFTARQPYLFAPQVLSVINFSETLRNVGRAVQGPMVQLLLTGMFGVLVIYVFMVIAFFGLASDLTNAGEYYDADVDATPCSTMLSCFPVFLVNGLLTGGGIGEFLSNDLGNTPNINADEHAVGRYVFDFAFFVIVIILLLNLIFGIILDTFSSLREQAKEQKHLRMSKCIVCGLSRQVFEEQLAGGWYHHYKHEHNLWNYLFFLIHLQTKEKQQFDGVEDYVARCVQQKDLTWIPRHAAIALKRNETTQGDAES